MKVKSVYTVIFLLNLVGSAVAQKDHLSSKAGEVSFGLGIGLPYGALGGRLGVNVIDNLNLFGGVGYQLAGVGYNFGILKDFETNSATQFYLQGMFGSNAAIVVEGLDEYDQIYTGVTFGLGVKINSQRTEGNFWDIGLLVPIRTDEFKADEETVKNDPRISEFNEAFPVLLTVGFNFNLK